MLLIFIFSLRDGGHRMSAINFFIPSEGIVRVPQSIKTQTESFNRIYSRFPAVHAKIRSDLRIKTASINSTWNCMRIMIIVASVQVGSVCFLMTPFYYKLLLQVYILYIYYIHVK